MTVKFIVELRFLICIIIMYPLSEGSLEKLINGEEIQDPLYFQILSVKKLTNFSKAKDSDRYRLKISDGQTTYSYVVLFTGMNEWVYSKLLIDFSIVQINAYSSRRVKYNGRERFVILIMNMEVLVQGYQINKIIGNVDVSFIEEKMQLVDLYD